MIYYDSQIIASQIVFSSIIVWLFRLAKQSSYISFINGETPKVNRMIAIVSSGLVALGLNWTYSYTPEGILTIQVTGLTLMGIYEGSKQWIFSYIVQQTGYRVTEPTMKLQEIK